MISDEYCFVAWSADVTGLLMLDEIVQLGAFCKDASFKQYIMPHRNMSYASQRRHQLRTMTTTYSRNSRSIELRILKDISTGTAVKTKTEVFAMTDFTSFLEKLANKENKPIVLVTFEDKKSKNDTFSIPLLLQSLNRHFMLERFQSVVKGFVNCHDYIKQKCGDTVSPFSLVPLVTILLNKQNINLCSAASRAECIYEMLIHLCAGEALDPIKVVGADLTPAIMPVDQLVTDLKSTVEMIRCQQSLKPLFLPLFRLDDKRQRGVDLRKILVTGRLFLDKLKEINSVEADLAESLRSRLPPFTTDEDIEEIAMLVKTHFDSNQERSPSSRDDVRADSVRNRRRSGRRQFARRGKNTTRPSETPQESQLESQVIAHPPGDPAIAVNGVDTNIEGLGKDKDSAPLNKNETGNE